jgi:hypothetical protein
MDPALTTALVVVGALFLVIWLLVYINNRDKKREARK